MGVRFSSLWKAGEKTNMNNTRYLELDFYRTSYQSVKAHQYDKNTRYIVVTCMNDASAYPLNPSTMTCNLKLITPDKRCLWKPAEIQADGTVLISIEEGMLLAAGICKAELNVFELDNQKLLSTMPFDLIVIGSVYHNSIIENTHEFSVLHDLLFKAHGIFETLKTHLADFANPHRVNKAQIGLGSCDNTADIDKHVSSAERLAAARDINGTPFDGTAGIVTDKWGKSRTIKLSGDVSASKSVDGSADVDMEVKIKDNSHEHTVSNISDITAAAAELNVLDGITASTDELNYTEGVTDNIQRQLDTKAPVMSPAFTGTPTSATAPAGTNTSQLATTAFTQAAVSGHNTSSSAHSDIRSLITELTSRLNALADSDDTTLDQLSEIVAYIKSNRSLIEHITTNKINTADIINDLTSAAANKPLSAKQGSILKELIDTLSAAVDNKVDKVSGKGLSANDYTTIEKNKLDEIANGNRQANKVWKTDADGIPGWREDAPDHADALLLSGGQMDAGASITFPEGHDFSNPAIEFLGDWFDDSVLHAESEDGCTLKISPGYIEVRGVENRKGYIAADEIDTPEIYYNGDIVHRKNDENYTILDSGNYTAHITKLTNLDTSGLINAGGKARMWTDNEGGNFGFSAPDGTQWEMDAVDGCLRIFTYENGVRTGLTINKYGQVTFINGAWSNEFHGTLYGALSGSMTAQGGVGGRGIHANANGFGIDLPPEEGYAGGLVWYQGNNSVEANAVGCIGYYKQGGYHYIGTNYENPAGELRTGIIRTNSHIYIKYGCALYARHIEGAGSDATLFLNYNHPASIVAVGDTDNHAGGTGLLYVGTRAAIWTDAEGGNVHIMSPNDVEYQMDAFNDNLRLYRHVGDDYRSAFVVLEDGTTDFPFGVVTDYICGTTGQYGRISITPNYPGRYKVLNDSTIHIGFDNEVGYCVAPYSDNHYMLGRALRRWKDVYAANSAIITSDESLKRDITPLDENMTKDFIMGLQPISYIRTDGESGRTHYGMGAQSVERLMEELGMTSMDFAGLIKSPMYEDYEVEEEVEVEKLVPNENGKPIPRKVREIQKVTKQREIPGRYRYGLRYEEFIAPLIKVVQMQQTELEAQQKTIIAQEKAITELKNDMAAMRNRLEKIEKMLGL